jgi:hypothetical protein
VTNYKPCKPLVACNLNLYTGSSRPRLGDARASPTGAPRFTNRHRPATRALVPQVHGVARPHRRPATCGTALPCSAPAAGAWRTVWRWRRPSSTGARPRGRYLGHGGPGEVLRGSPLPGVTSPLYRRGLLSSPVKSDSVTRPAVSTLEASVETSDRRTARQVCRPESLLSATVLTAPVAPRRARPPHGLGLRDPARVYPVRAPRPRPRLGLRSSLHAAHTSRLQRRRIPPAAGAPRRARGAADGPADRRD